VAGRGRTVSLRRGAPRWVRVAVPRRGRAATLVVSAGGAAIGRYALPRR
jgi:hypothetical protein